MSAGKEDSDVMVEWYRGRIAEPRTDDEVYGYWVFVFGILLGALGILLYLTSYPDPGSIPGKAGIGLAGVALILLMVGPIIRLPLRRTATLVSYAGSLVSFLGVVWFLLSYPGWREAGVATPIITLYAFGVVLIAVGAAFVPVAGNERRAEASTEEQTAVEELTEEPTGAESSGEAVAADERDRAGGGAVEEPAGEAPSKARFELYEDRAGKWRWRLRHRNGNVIADGGQGYSSRQKARQGLESVQKNAGGAAVVQQEVEVEEPEEPADAPYPAGESQGTFEVYEDAAGEYRWRLVHDNGNIIADGGQGYASRSDAEEAVERVRGYVGPADYLRIDPTAFEVYRDAGGDWRWRLLHRNGQILADSGEGYAERTGAQEGIKSARDALDGEDAFEIFEDSAGEYRWRLRASNDEIVADGGEGFATERGARESVRRFREYAPEASVLDYRDAAFEIFEDGAGEFRWRLLHENGQIMGDSGEGYASRTGAIEGIQSVKRNAPNAEVELLDEGDEGDEAASEEEDEADEAAESAESGDEDEAAESAESGDEDEV